MPHLFCGHLLQRVKILAACMKTAHDQRNRAAADVVLATVIIIGYATLTTCVGVENSAAVPATIEHLMMVQMEEKEMPDVSEYIMNRNGVDFILSSMVLSAVGCKTET